ncbi:MAG: hypothetical protein P8Y18_12130 [Candidatus Bathyarchaeota archaeon]
MEEVKDLNDLKKLLSEGKNSSDVIREIFKWYNFSENKNEPNY